jgi:hypothetical protein
MHLGLLGGCEVSEVLFQQFFQLLRGLFPSVFFSHIDNPGAGGC